MFYFNIIHIPLFFVNSKYSEFGMIFKIFLSI